MHAIGMPCVGVPQWDRSVHAKLMDGTLLAIPSRTPYTLDFRIFKRPQRLPTCLANSKRVFITLLAKSWPKRPHIVRPPSDPYSIHTPRAPIRRRPLRAKPRQQPPVRRADRPFDVGARNLSVS
eukprot:363544-Chlamydomonas_euryale.AAC.4